MTTPTPPLYYNDYLDDLGFSKSKWNHFRSDGHKKWAEFLLPYVQRLIKQ